MAIVRCAHDERDHSVARLTAQNKAVSYEALGMLTYLLSQPDDWVIGVDDLIREGCGRDKAYRILKELSDAGHLTRVRIGVGQSKPPVWADRTVYEQPITEKPEMVPADTGFTKSVKAGNGEVIPPVPEKPDLANTSENPRNPEKPDFVKSSPSHAGAVVLALQNQSAQRQEIQELKEKDKSTLFVMDDPDAPATEAEREHARQIMTAFMENMNANGGGHWKTDAEIRAETEAALLKYPNQRKVFGS